MASNKDFINILRELRGTGAPGEAYTDGIWYELTQADINGNPGIYGDILAKYGVVVDNTATLDQAVAIIDGLTVVANPLAEGATPTASLIGTTLTLGIPVGATGAQGLIGPIGPTGPQGPKGDTGATGPAGADGADGHTPTQLEIDAVVSTNVNVLAAQTLLDDTIVDATIAIDATADGKIAEYNANAVDRVQEYDDNHTTKLAIYNSNDTTKISQYNDNHIARLEDINFAYADRIVEMIKTRNFMGILDEYVAQTETHMIPFLSTDDANYIYYGNGTLLELGVDYTVYDSTTIELVVKANPYDVIVQVNTQVLNDMLIAERILFEDRIGAPNGVAGLDANGLVPTTQLPSYVDDVIEVATYADLPVTGEADKIYVVVADETSGGNTSSYRWTGTVYAMVSNTLTAEDIKALYESNANTNEFTDAEKTKLSETEITSQLNDRDIANRDRANHTGTQELDTITETADKKIMTRTERDKLAGIETNATADQTASEIEGLYEGLTNTNKYTDAEKLLVDVATVLATTATTLPTAVNEVHDELDSVESRVTILEAETTDLAIANRTATTLDVTSSDGTDATIPEVTATEAGLLTAADKVKLDTIEANAKDDQTGSEIKALYEANTDTNAYTDAEKDKVGYISVTEAIDLDTIGSDTLLNTTHRTSSGTDHTYIDQDVTTTATPTFAGLVTAGLVDGRDVSVDGAKLDTIENWATADQTAVEIEGLYEGLVNTNKFTDAEKVQVAATETTTQLNARDTANRARANHTGTQLLTTVTPDNLVGAPTNIDDMTKLFNQLNSAGVMGGCELTDNGDGTVNIAAGYAMLRDSADAHSTLHKIEVSAQNNLVLLEGVNYIALEWNAGLPTFVTNADMTTMNCWDVCLAHIAVREGTKISHKSATEQNVDGNRKTRRLFMQFERMIHLGDGSKLGDAGALAVSVTAGKFNFMLEELSHVAFDTSIVGTANENVFDLYYRDGVGGWTKTIDQKVIDTTTYDTGSGTLGVLGNNKYGVTWFYMVLNNPDQLVAIKGQEEYPDYSSAAIATPPVGVPAIIEGLGVLLGYVAYEKGTTEIDGVFSSFTQTFSSSQAVTHNSLSGLQGGAVDDYQHLTTTELSKLTGIENGATADQLASEVPVTPNGNLSSINVQLALEELQTDIDTINATIEW